MFDEDMEEKKAGMIGSAILAGGGIILGILGTLGGQKGLKLWKEHEAKKEASASEEK